jgi:hypothetical protein
LLGKTRRSWDSKIKYALWADRITKKASTGKSPFELVYGLDVKLPIHLKLPTYGLLQDFTSEKDAVQNKINQMIELDENRKERLMIRVIKIRKRLKGNLINQQDRGISESGIQCCYGIKAKKNQANMESLTTYGWVHI